jgi:hypothetical protein
MHQHQATNRRPRLVIKCRILFHNSNLINFQFLPIILCIGFNVFLARWFSLSDKKPCGAPIRSEHVQFVVKIYDKSYDV